MAGSQFIEHILEEFEAAWQTDTPPDLAEALASAAALAETDRRELWRELVAIDLEYRWRSRNHTLKRHFLEDYADDIDMIPIELIAEEYRVRQRWGDRPEPEDYQRRFPSSAATLIEALQRIDDELSVDDDENKGILPAQAPVAFHVGETPMKYADYTLQQLLGSGGVGKVYRATEIATGRSVAIKYLKKAFQNDAIQTARFVHEARIVSAFTLPGVVSAEGWGRTPQGGYFFVMELIDGPNLQQVADIATPAASTAARWIHKAAQTMSAVHQADMIHCDLKPSNLLLDTEGNVRVTDFGFVRRADSSMTGIWGTAAYMASEQIYPSFEALTPRTDVYGLGAVLFQLLTGAPPADASRAADCFTQILTQKPDDLRARFPATVEPQLREVCLRCLERNPARRYESAAALAEALSFLT